MGGKRQSGKEGRGSGIFGSERVESESTQDSKSGRIDVGTKWRRRGREEKYS